jgi:hypothetical protein
MPLAIGGCYPAGPAMLIVGGVNIHEYRPGMIHSKILLVDAVWSGVDSTNFDNCSFGLNNEVISFWKLNESSRPQP